MRRYAGPVLVLLLLFGLRYHDQIRGSRFFGPFNDTVYFFGSTLAAASRVAMHGETPYWIPELLGGVQIFDSPQLSIAYPFYFLGWLDYGTGLQMLATIHYITLFHLLILLFSAFLLMRAVGASRWGSVVGAALVLLAGNTASFTSFVSRATSYAWLPLLFAGVFDLMRRPGSWRGVVAIAVAALGMLGSPSQALIHGTLVSAVLVGVGLLFREHRRWPIFGRLAVAGLLSFGLSAVGIIPMAMGKSETIRWVGIGAIVGGERMPWEAFTHEKEQIAPRDAAHFLFDDGRMRWRVSHPFVGAVALLLAPLGVAVARRRSRVTRSMLWVLGGIGLWGLWSAFGSNLGAAQINYRLPLINLIRQPVHQLPLLVIALAAFAALGATELMRKREGEAGGARSTLLLMAFLAAMAALVAADTAGAPHQWGLAWLLPPAAVLLAFTLPAHAAATTVLFALVFVQGCTTRVGNVPGHGNWDYLKSRNLASMQVLSRIAELDPDEDYRAVFEDARLDKPRWSANAVQVGVRAFQSRWFPLPVEQYRQMFNMDNYPAYRSLLGTRWYVYGPEVETTRGEHELLFTLDGYRVMENPRAAPRLFLARSVAGTYDSVQDFIERIEGSQHRYDAGLYLPAGGAESVSRLLEGAVETADSILRVEARSVNRLKIGLSLPAPAVLVVNEFRNENWHLKVDGRRREHVEVNLNQIGVPLTAGSHLVELQYRPTLFARLRWLQLATAGLMALAAVSYVGRRYGKSGRHVSPAVTRPERSPV